MAIINGGAGDDLLIGDLADVPEADTINGLGGNDRLRGEGAVDTLNGGDGDDQLRGGAGADVLVGGLGRDEAEYQDSDAGVTINLQTGAAFGGFAAGDSFSSIADIDGSNFNDNLAGPGSTGPHIFEGLGGNDVLTGGNGADGLFGSTGNDLLRGAGGGDVLSGGTGIDTITYSEAGSGVTGAVYIDLGAGIALGGNAEGDSFSGIENVNGSNGWDTLIGDANANVLDGLDGDDILTGGAGADTLVGGIGTEDEADYSDSAAAVTVNLALGTGSGGDAAGDTLSGIEDLTGSAQDDVLTGNAAANLLDGALGDDVLEGGAGADLIGGNIGVDAASYAGSAAAVFVDLGDAIVESGGDAAGDVLNLIENLVGSAFADTLEGDTGANAIQGGAGNDFLRGDGGADLLIGAGGIDRASYLESGVGVKVDLTAGTGTGGTAAGDTLATIENLNGSDFADTLTGNGFANDFVGNGGKDLLKGLAGSDTLSGGADNDTLDGGTGADTMNGGAGNDQYVADHAGDTANESTGQGTADLVEASVTFTLGANVENLSLTGTGAIGGTGNASANALKGNGGDNVLQGLGADDVLFGFGGDDTLEGGAGSDHLTGGTGKDVFDFNAVGESPVGAARDRVTDFGHLVDRIDLATIDAEAGVAGNQAFHFIGTALFSGTVGELRISAAGIVQGDVDGEGTADFHIQLQSGVVVTAADFVL